MDKTKRAPVYKTILATLAVLIVATFGVIASGTVNETLIDAIQAW